MPGKSDKEEIVNGSCLETRDCCFEHGLDHSFGYDYKKRRPFF